MVKPLLKLSYVGDDFSGYQAQRGSNARTVQGELNRAAKELFGFDCNITGCSRTDSGVHALAYYAAITPSSADKLKDGWCKIPKEKLPLAMNAHLPDDIAVLDARFVDLDFHPRYSVKSKTYIYKIHDGPIFDPFLRKRAAMYPKKLSQDDISRMDSAAKLFCGKHDFRAFMSQGSSVQNTEREVYCAAVSREDDGTVTFRVSANGFLYNMVRIMVGTLIDVAADRRKPDSVTEALIGKDRTKCGATAPPWGLYLYDVEY